MSTIKDKAGYTDEAENPLISVIIPVYNAVNDFPRCIESVMYQTYDNLEIIVVDDGSNDGSAAVCDYYASIDSRIAVIHQANKGVSAARNVGIATSSGLYISFPDGDDYLDADYIKKLYGLCIANDCDIAMCEYFVTFEDHETAHVDYEKCYGKKNTIAAQELICGRFPFACTKLYRRGVVSDIRFDETILRGEDTLYALQAAGNAKNVWFDKEPLYHYVQTKESACRGKFRTNQLSAILLYEKYESLFSDTAPWIMPIHYMKMAHILIGLYFDMYMDEESFDNEMEYVHTIFCKHMNEAMKGTRDFKSRLKFGLFKASPFLYCMLHTRLHNL